VKKDIKYYLNLNYPIEIVKIPDDEGGGYSACIPILGRSSFISDGETIEEALRNLEAIKKENFQRMLDKGIPIPEPTEQSEEEYSGKFLIRIPKELHRELTRKSTKNGISLNQYIIYVLTKGLAVSSFEEIIGNYLSKLDYSFFEMKKIDYQIEEKDYTREYDLENQIFNLEEINVGKYSSYTKAG